MSDPQSTDPAILLTQFLSEEARGLLTSSGKDLIRRVGLDVIRSVVLDVLTGRNIRNSTEILTRRRIAALNLATAQLFVQGSQQIDHFIERLPTIATDILSVGKSKKEERWLAQWILGVTDQGVQNILRDDVQLLNGYRDSYIRTCAELIHQQELTYGTLKGSIEIGSQMKASLNWLFLVYLLNTTGAQTLTIRGSDKSTYGKLFEKLVLGTLLHLLGFKFQKSADLTSSERVFWLSSKDDQRESDATLLYSVGKGIRFDIGFIGRGNTEISLDKVSRYRREIELGSEMWYMGTLIIVDRIGERSRIPALASQIEGEIIQMSAGYWPQRVAKSLNRRLGFDHPLLSLSQSEIGDFLTEHMKTVPLDQFID
jgi:hypothetical protein